MFFAYFSFFGFNNVKFAVNSFGFCYHLSILYYGQVLQKNEYKITYLTTNKLNDSFISKVIIKCYYNSTEYFESPIPPSNHYNKLFIDNCSPISFKNAVFSISNRSIETDEIYFVNFKQELTEDLLQLNLHIKKFAIRKSSITTIPSKFFQNSSNFLEELEFYSTDLEQINKNTFSNLNFLKSLSFIFNKKLKTIESKSFDNLTTLNKLWILGSNSLKNLPDGILKYVKNLKELTLSSNKFDDLPNNLLNDIENNELIKFDFSDNKGDLTSLPEGFFQNSNKLQQVILNNNQLQSIPEKLFSTLKDLLELDLSGNHLSNLPSALFKYTTDMRRLDLSNNRLTNIHEDLFKKMQLCDLDLSHNQLTKLSS